MLVILNTFRAGLVDLPDTVRLTVLRLLGKLYVLSWSVSVQKRTMAMAYQGLSNARAVASVILLSSLLALGTASAQGVSRENGEFWTYEMTVSEEIMGVRAEMSGQIIHTARGEGSLSIEEEDVSTTIIGIEGSLNGSVYALGQSVGGAEVSISGTRFDLIGTPGVLEENTTTISDVTISAGSLSFTYQLREQVSVSIHPAVLAEFDPDVAIVGDSWTRTVETLTTSTAWVDGVATNTTVLSSNLTYSVAVTGMESVETPSGIYSTLVVRVSDGEGGLDIFWWSSEVDNFVRHDVYRNGSDARSSTMVLVDFGSSDSSDMTVYIIIGVVVFVVGAAVLALVLSRKHTR